MDFIRLLHDNDIIRRYIVMNSFDGTLTSLGIIIAMTISGVTDVKLILVSAIGVIFATGISGVWGAYLVEKAERKHELAELHRLYPQEDLVERKKEFKQLTLIMGLANGLSSSVIGFVIISPYFLAALGFLTIQTAFWVALLIILVSLVVIGSFTATIAKESLTKHAGATLIAAVIVGLVIYFFELLKFI